MAKGKYAARAANRLAEIDQGIISELKAKLESVTAERDSAALELEYMRRDAAAEARRIAQGLAEEAVRAAHAELAEAKEAHESERVCTAKRVMELMGREGVRAPVGFHAGVLEALGVKDGVYEIMAGEAPQTRRQRRGRVQDLRSAQAMTDRIRGVSESVALKLEDRRVAISYALRTVDSTFGEQVFDLAEGTSAEEARRIARAKPGSTLIETISTEMVVSE